MSTERANGTSAMEIGQSNQELLEEKRFSRKKRKIIMSIIIFIVLLLITGGIALFLVTENSDIPKSNYFPLSSITLEDVIYGQYSASGLNSTWVSDNEILYRNEEYDIILHNINNGKSTFLYNLDPSIYFPPLHYKLSPDQKFLLIGHQLRKSFRYSTLGQYIIIDLITKTNYPLIANGEKLLQIALWGPIGNSIIFVAKNNIFYKKSAMDTNINQITKDGSIGEIFNGIPDWIYEEEIFASNKAFWVSPDGKNLAYAKFTDTLVPTFTIPIYGEPGVPEFQYPKALGVRYPKAGAPNPNVTLHLVNLESLQTVTLVHPFIREAILSTVAWANTTTVNAIWMNRVQNEAFIIAYSTLEPDNPKTVKYLKESRGWLELFKPPVFSKDGLQFLLILSQEQDKNVGSYRHLVKFDNKENGEMHPVTKGKFVVTSVLGWSGDNTIYYQATIETNPGVRHIFAISPNSTAKCLTCQLKRSRSNVECLYNSAEFSEEFTYAMIECQGPHVPEIFLFKNMKFAKSWDSYESLYESIMNVSLPKSQTYVLNLQNGLQARVMLQLPPNLDTTAKKKYPMLVEVYAGPDTQKVNEEFYVDWGSYLAVEKDVIHAVIDGRGSAMQGDNLLFSSYRKLGTVEVIDQIEVTKQLLEKLSFIDPKKTAIWGWSYGGYASGMALALDEDNTFKCGISVAPVTDWTLYDSIYTERYMGLPTKDDNLKGYVNASLLNKFEGLRGKEYFLIHGTLDDNVHYQQSMLLAKQLEQNDILFYQLSYPDQHHGLDHVRLHLYHSLEKFLDNCFSGIEY